MAGLVEKLVLPFFAEIYPLVENVENLRLNSPWKHINEQNFLNLSVYQMRHVR